MPVPSPDTKGGGEHNISGLFFFRYFKYLLLIVRKFAFSGGFSALDGKNPSGYILLYILILYINKSNSRFLNIIDNRDININLKNNF